LRIPLFSSPLFFRERTPSSSGIRFHSLRARTFSPSLTPHLLSVLIFCGPFFTQAFFGFFPPSFFSPPHAEELQGDSFLQRSADALTYQRLNKAPLFFWRRTNTLRKTERCLVRLGSSVLFRQNVSSSLAPSYFNLP